LKLLIGGSPSKFFHLKEFGESLKQFGIDYKLVVDTDIFAGFPSKRISDWFDMGKRFKKLIDEFKPDAVFVDRQTNFGLAVLKAQIPLFVHLRGDYWTEIKMARETLYKYPPKSTIISIKEKIANRCFDGSTLILPICKYLEKKVKEHHPEKDTSVLYQGIDPSRWHKTKGLKFNHPCVGLLQGAVIWDKTKEMLVLEEVLKAFPEVTFYWAGDGPYRDKILPVLQKYENFVWLGSLQYPEKVREFFSEIDVYYLMSGIDMSPLTLLEAQLMKKPVVATNVGGIPELMENNETGFLVKKGAHSEWIEKLEILINDEKKRKLMGEKGRVYVEKKIFGGRKLRKNLLI